MTIADPQVAAPAVRRELHLDDTREVLAEIARLRHSGYDRVGSWSLPQIAAHLAHVIERSLTPPPNIEPTPEQSARRVRFFGIVFGPEGMPAGMPLPAESMPPTDAGDDQFERYTAALALLNEYPHSHVLAGGAGPIRIMDARKLHVAHAAHHLSFLLPKPTRRQHLSFFSERGVVSDVNRLRIGYRSVANWTLAQTCWHLSAPLRIPLEGATPPAEISAEQQDLIDALDRRYARAGDTVRAFPAPPSTEPPADCGGDAIDELIERLAALEHFTSGYIAFGRFGVVPTTVYRRFVLNHCAHHLSLLVPLAPRREGLSYPHEDFAADDIQHLRRGYVQTGDWSLPQICWHLNVGARLRMDAGPHPDGNTAEQDERAPMLKHILDSGVLPLGIVAPDRMLPPENAGDEAIEACLESLDRIKRFTGKFAPHRLFGYLSPQEVRRHNLIHFAHHLSYLVPTT